PQAGPAAARQIRRSAHGLDGAGCRARPGKRELLAAHPGGPRGRAARRAGPPARPPRTRRGGRGGGGPAGNRQTPATRGRVEARHRPFNRGRSVGGSVILLVLIVVVALWVVGAYNGLVSLKNQTLNAFKQIDVQLKRRHDLIPNLVNAVRGAMDFEKSTLEAVIQARNQAVKVNAAGPEGIKQISQAENALSSALQRLMVVVEQYPQLKATGNVGQLQEELTSTENKVAFARQLYNDTATQYNTKQQQVPTNLVAGVARAQPADLWEIEEQADRAVPQVD